jgi:hypothetical protein
MTGYALSMTGNPDARPARWSTSSRGVDWELELDRADLLPGRLVAGRVTLTARTRVAARRLLVTLRGREHWRYEVTSRDAQGGTHTSRRTGREDLPAIPVQVAEPVALAAGESRTFGFELPGPSLGPPTIEAEVAGAAWWVEASLDLEGGPDSSIEAPVRVLQPTALLRAGIVPVGEFGLYRSVDATDEPLAGSIELDPVPLVAGAPFRGRVLLRAAGEVAVRGVRAELKVHVEATVSRGLDETLVAWSAEIARPERVAGEAVIEFAGRLDPRTPPTAVLPHGRTTARLEVILDIPWRPDERLARDVAVASTGEL